MEKLKGMTSMRMQIKIRRVIASFLAVLLFGTIIPLPANAASVEDLTYSITNGEVAITDCDTSASGELIISETIDGYPVTSINDFAFDNCSSLENIILPSGVTKIGNYAFYNCSSLASINIPSEVSEIGSFAFYNCSNLTSINIPSKVKSIGGSAFNGENLKDVHITDLTAWCQIDFETSTASPMRFAENLYLNGEKLEGELTIPSGITRIDDGVFANCNALTSVSLPNSVTSIGDCTFIHCTGLISINIPSNVKEIGNLAFLGCNNLNEVHTTSLKSWCEIDFADTYSTPMWCAKSLYINGEKLSGELNIPSEITGIKENTFYNFDDITSINFPTNLESIGNWAFADCENLTSVSIPDGVTTIGEYVFRGCYDLVSVSMPAEVTSIGNSAFSFCTSLTDIDIPEGVTTIGKQAFYYCKNLGNTIIPSSVTSIEEEAFAECPNLVLYTDSSYVYDYAIANTINCVYAGMTSLEVEQMPTKTEYCLNESSNMSGLALRAFYGDGSSKIITSGFEISGFDSTKAGICTITAKYGEYEVSFDVNVNAVHRYDDDKDNFCNICAHQRAVESLEIKSLPQKTTYVVGDEFDATGLVLQVNYNDGTSKEVNNGFTLIGFDSSKEGTCKITVEYIGEETTFDVIVGTMPLSSIEFASQSIQIVLGDTYQSEIIYTPSNATYKEVSWKSLDNSIATVDADGIITGISDGTTKIQAISKNGLIAECVVTVTNCKEISTSSEWFAIKNNPSGMTYILKSNIDVGSTILTIPSSKEVVIDLNGYMVEGTDCIIANNGKLTITDSAAGGTISLETESIDTQCDLIKNNGTLKITGGKLQIISNADNQYSAIVDLHGINNYGTLEIEDGEIFVNTFVVSNNAGNFVNGIYNQSGGTIVMTGGEITVETTTETYLSGNKVYSYIYGIYNESVNDLNISGATINCIHVCALFGYTNTVMVQGIQNHVAADITVKDTAIDVYVAGRAYDVTGGICGIYNLSNGTVKVDSSEINVDAEIALDIVVSGINNSGTGSIIVGSLPVSTNENMKIITSHTNNYNSAIDNVDIGSVIVQRGQLEGHIGLCNLSTGRVELGVNDGLVNSDMLSIKAPGDILVSTSQIDIYDGKLIGNLNAAVPVRIPAGWSLSKSTNNGVDEYILIGKPLEAIKLDKAEIQLIEGKGLSLIVQYTPSDTTDDKTVIWSSSDETIVTVDANGNIKALKPGTAIITATVGSISTSCKIIVLSNNWKKDNVGWWYQNPDGTYPYSCWKQIEGKWYYFNASGYRVTGWQSIGGTWYYMNADGVMVTGWQFIGNSWYYLNGSGAMVTGWQSIGGDWYYFHGSGAMASNQWIGSYYLKADGVMATNQWVGNYYVQSNGAYVSKSGWLLVGSDWYYLGTGGVRLTNQWKKDSVGWCYLDESGKMATNRWVMDSQGWCYVGANGYCVTNTWMRDSVGWCYLDENGRMATNRWIKDSQGWCYVGANGYCVTNTWIQDSVGWCYLDENGRMATNQWIDGEYWVGSDGRWIPNYENTSYYLQKLKSYITNYGGTNSSGNKFISSSLTDGSTTYSFGIVYNSSNDELSFLMTYNGNGTDASIAMPVKAVSNTILQPKLTIIIGSYACQAVANVNPATYTGEFDVYFSMISTIGFKESQIQETGNALLQFGFLAWSDLVQEAGVTMQQIGFTAYTY